LARSFGETIREEVFDTRVNSHNGDQTASFSRKLWNMLHDKIVPPLSFLLLLTLTLWPRDSRNYCYPYRFSVCKFCIPQLILCFHKSLS